MVWSHYLQETKHSETDDNNDSPRGDDDERNIPRNKPLPYDMWCTWFSNDLMNLWMTFRAYREDTGNEPYLLDDCSYESFTRFCYNHSSKYPSKFPS